MGLVSQTSYFNSKQQTTWFPFKVIPLASNALFHPTLPRFYALLEGFIWDAPQLRHYGPLDGLHAFKTGPLNDPFELGEKKKVVWSKVR